MPSFLAGSRMSAGAVNAFTALSVDISGQTTSGDDELVLPGVLSIPAAPIDRLVVASYHLFLNSSGGTGDRATVRIRQGGISGAIRAHGLRVFTGTIVETAEGRGRPFLLAAGVSLDLVCTTQRSFGTGNIAIGGAQNLNGIAVEFFPVP